MSINARPPVVSLIPENAPFTPEQREWLNGFFAALLSLEEAATPLSAAQAATLIPGSLAAPSATEPSREDRDDGEAP